MFFFATVTGLDSGDVFVGVAFFALDLERLAFVGGFLLVGFFLMAKSSAGCSTKWCYTVTSGSALAAFFRASLPT